MTSCFLDNVYHIGCPVWATIISFVHRVISVHGNLFGNNECHLPPVLCSQELVGQNQYKFWELENFKVRTTSHFPLIF